jgi:hypothetical protein
MRAVLSMALMVIAAGAGYVGYQMNNPTLLFGAFAALVVGGAVWQYWPALAVATRIDHGLVTIRGCGTDFLASLPVGGPAQFSARAAPSDLAVATARLTRRI